MCVHGIYFCHCLMEREQLIESLNGMSGGGGEIGRQSRQLPLTTEKFFLAGSHFCAVHNR
jgi:hypothetical protein